MVAPLKSSHRRYRRFLELYRASRGLDAQAAGGVSGEANATAPHGAGNRQRQRALARYKAWFRPHARGILFVLALAMLGIGIE
jgi:hypothetical protein